MVHFVASIFLIVTIAVGLLAGELTRAPAAVPKTAAGSSETDEEMRERGLAFLAQAISNRGDAVIHSGQFAIKKLLVSAPPSQAEINERFGKTIQRLEEHDHPTPKKRNASVF